MAVSVLSVLRVSQRNFQSLLRPCIAQAGFRFWGKESSQPPGIPKKPPTAFMAFFNEKRSSIMDANPGIRVTESSRIAGEMWRYLTDEERKVYKDNSHNMFVEYKVNRQEFLDSLTPEQKEQMETDRKRKRQRKLTTQRKMLLKELNKPSRGLISPFFCFAQSHKLDRGEAPLREFTKGLAEYWKRMPVEEKEPYVAQSRENKKRYETAMLAWEKEMITEGRPELVRGYKPPKPAKKIAKKSAKKIAKSTKKITKKKTSSSPKKKSKSTQTEDEDTTWMREE
ncbi:hypothetical protein LSAT2_009344 [Lamellibrachia satsuma]|nr:hypothetical protein LSAT2_009344 [Lamellibrachia satsuma]